MQNNRRNASKILTIEISDEIYDSLKNEVLPFLMTDKVRFPSGKASIRGVAAHVLYEGILAILREERRNRGQEKKYSNRPVPLRTD